MAEEKINVTFTWPKELADFVRGPVFKKTRVRIGQLSELAMVMWLKENGYWAEYQESLAGDIL
jgi:hypothetical protein